MFGESKSTTQLSLFALLSWQCNYVSVFNNSYLIKKPNFFWTISVVKSFFK